jgi:ABC-type bacteriocin/lantibiotic exporter with double-glycine peptidase domain
MKLKTQPDNYSCGIYSIINALMIYGENLSREEVINLTHTTRNGTDEKGLINALEELGYKYKIYTTKNKDNAWRWVLSNSANYPLILYVDKDHWLVVAGRIKNKVILLDSVDTAHIVDKQELLKRWQDTNYWGIKVI